MEECVMVWETPVVTEISVALEVTSYAGEDDDLF
jgi:coenzyme PQQ precursor peptide PqqA